LWQPGVFSFSFGQIALPLLCSTSKQPGQVKVN
jgi:hypothetical protein